MLIVPVSVDPETLPPEIAPPAVIPLVTFSELNVPTDVILA